MSQKSHRGTLHGAPEDDTQQEENCGAFGDGTVPEKSRNQDF